MQIAMATWYTTRQHETSGPIMAMAANTTIVQTHRPAEVGEIDPEMVITPGLFVDRVVAVLQPAQESVLVREGRVYP